MEVTGIVLAGGKSSRMGTDKSRLELEGMTVLERIAEKLSKASCRVVVAGREGEVLAGMEAVSDQYPGRGPLAGLHAGLKASGTEWNIVCACDMPLVNAETLLALRAEAAKRWDEGSLLTAGGQNWDAVIPVIDDRRQPLLAAYHRRVLPGLEERLQTGRLRMQDWLDTINAAYVDGESLAASGPRSADKVFFNMNEQDDYRQVCAWIREEKSTAAPRGCPAPSAGHPRA
ncbi:molybdenum cofactor guanylyltransferase [Paenibacillus enshidis]|uniref:Probable molybdenum cofactor guanylyltransferase n=1 Tax=Paenibacillus enshidis TaxID=1458439 RepID=A0ABV5ARE6_9BACL